jgi:hypothetical protein
VDSYNPPFEYQVGDEGASEMNGRDHNATHATYTALRRVRTIFLPRGSQTYETWWLGSILFTVRSREVHSCINVLWSLVALQRTVLRFQRCLDLYLCPRMVKHRLDVRPQDILPSLPTPKVVYTVFQLKPCHVRLKRKRTTGTKTVSELCLFEVQRPRGKAKLWQCFRAGYFHKLVTILAVPWL